MKVIEEKIAAGGKELPATRRAVSSSTKVVDIVAMLQESIKQTRKSKPKEKARKTA
jgi:DNA end-binding protein Ku